MVHARAAVRINSKRSATTAYHDTAGFAIHRSPEVGPRIRVGVVLVRVLVLLLVHVHEPRLWQCQTRQCYMNTARQQRAKLLPPA